MEKSTPFQITSHLGKTGAPTKQTSPTWNNYETSLGPSGWSLIQEGERPMKKKQLEKQAGDLAVAV